ncbi:O-antigen ligase family protein [Candidatus Pelagibacter sp. HIMB1509]|uniref:O-antigen ligase family protein n=1 Tax=Candidatus Pelagibacter sp. HIMB1509 TaxID=3413339 RepID=UPI003F873305
MQIKIDMDTNKNDKLKSISLISLTCITPLFYILGSFYANFITVSCLLWVIIFHNNEIKNYLKYNYIFYTLIFFLVINIIVSEDKFNTAHKAFGYLRFTAYGLFVLIAFDFLKNKNLKQIGIFLLIFNILVSFDTIYQFIFDIDFFGNSVNYKHAYGRLSGPFGTEYIVGIYLFCFGIISIFFINLFFNLNKFSNFLLFLFFFITIFITGERNAFLTTLIFLFFLFFINKENRGLILFIFVSLIISTIIIISYSKVLKTKYNFLNLPTVSNSQTEILSKNNESEKNQDINKNEKKFEKNKINNNKNNNTNNKLEKLKKIFFNNMWFAHYKAGILIFKDNFFFGTGIKSFRNECIKVIEYEGVVCTTHPHNIYVELLSDTGIIGLMFFLFYVYKIIEIFIKRKLYNNFAYSIVLAMNLSFIFPFKPHGSFFTTNNAFLFWYIFSVLIWIVHSKKNEI